jgi:hypothetical protein
MKMEKGKYYGVLLMALVVAVVASLGTVALTGNVIRVSSSDPVPLYRFYCGGVDHFYTQSWNAEGKWTPGNNKSVCKYEGIAGYVMPGLNGSVVYTQGEIDSKFKQLGAAAYWGNLTSADYYNLKEIKGTDIEVLEMLNQRCEVVDGSESGITKPEEYNCQNICSKKRADLICTFGIGTFKVSNSIIGDQKVVARSCQENTSPYNTHLSCMCCHSP